MSLFWKSEDGQTNGTTVVTVVTAPLASVTRIVPVGGISITNRDTVNRTFVLKFKHDTDLRIIREKQLVPDETYFSEQVLVLDDTDKSIEVELTASPTVQSDWVSDYVEHQS